MNFIEAVKVCFAKYATSNGRAVRSEYWYFTLFWAIGTIITVILDSIFFPGLVEGAYTPLNMIFSLGILLPYIGVAARRLHDVNRSGWWQLIPLTIIGIIPYIYWVTKKGDEGEKKGEEWK